MAVLKQSQLVKDHFDRLIINANGKAHLTGYILVKNDLVGFGVYAGRAYYKSGTHITEAFDPFVPVMHVRSFKELDINQFVAAIGWKPEE